ncbi:hypothetical protein [Kitasatospora sp. NPDC057223]|uniref:hypothetical protein n=1 Tax=Kitasatospora sp. NPDC057223 TaxID=3346055 RepID=UPI003629CDC6
MPTPARLLATTALALTFATSASPALTLFPVSPGTPATAATTVPADPSDPAGSTLGGTGDLGIGWDDWI